MYAEPFAAAIRDGGLASIMNSYASIDGLAPAASRALLTDLLRDELGFDGTVVADYFSVDLLVTHHRVAPNQGGRGGQGPARRARPGAAGDGLLRASCRR